MFEKPLTPAVEDIVAGSVVLSSRPQAWAGLEVMQAHFDFNELVVPALDSHTIVINLGQSFELNGSISGRPHRNYWKQGGLKIVSAGLPSRWDWKPEFQLNVLHLSLTASFLAGIAEQVELNPAQLEVISRVGLEDRPLQQIGLTLLAELQNDRLAGRLYAESLVNVLTVHLLRNYTNSLKSAQKQLADPPGQLSRRTLQTITDYINEHLDRELSLTELAELARLSPFHFSRLFKQTTGLTPHQYVVERRLERARLLLQTTKLPIQEIAFRLGFTDQSHLARQFRRFFGYPPSALRK